MTKEDILKIIDLFIETQKLEVMKLDLDRFIAYKTTIGSLLTLLSFVKESPDLRFTILTDLFAADFPDRLKRFEVVYNLLSLKLNRRLLFKIEVTEEEPVPSTTQIFNAACWYEREAYDMFGINFSGSHDLRRILTDYGFIGHPLRKDFPLTGHLQVKYDQSLEQIIYEPVQLEQEFRMFDFLSPWKGPDYVLPGDEKATK
jgi:NADH-quinone oxidoreductase subunit C